MAGTMKINQSMFVQNLVIKKRLTNCNANVIPMKAGLFIHMSGLANYKEVNLCIYQCLIRKLMYFAWDTRPNIAFAVGQPSKHNPNLKKTHFRAVKRVVRYLKRIIEIGLTFGWDLIEWLSIDLLFYGLIGYVDSIFAEDLED